VLHAAQQLVYSAQRGTGTRHVTVRYMRGAHIYAQRCVEGVTCSV